MLRDKASVTAEGKPKFEHIKPSVNIIVSTERTKGRTRFVNTVVNSNYTCLNDEVTPGSKSQSQRDAPQVN